MKVYLLAAGRGERLKPVTDATPKCLVSINNKPLLQIWLEQFEKTGIKEVFINTHHFAQRIEDYLKANRFNLKVTTSFEKELLGSAGTLAQNKDFVKGERYFLIVYADNLTSMDLNKIIQAHYAKGAEFTMGLFRSANPCACGIAELDCDGRVVGFVEKPQQPMSNLANAGIFVSSQKIFDYIPPKRPADLGFDVLPQLVGKMYGYVIDDYYIDIGTVNNYNKACREWKNNPR